MIYKKKVIRVKSNHFFVFYIEDLNNSPFPLFSAAEPPYIDYIFNGLLLKEKISKPQY
jgi:hypothetical protein